MKNMTLEQFEKEMTASQMQAKRKNLQAKLGIPANEYNLGRVNIMKQIKWVKITSELSTHYEIENDNSGLYISKHHYYGWALSKCARNIEYFSTLKKAKAFLEKFGTEWAVGKSTKAELKLEIRKVEEMAQPIEEAVQEMVQLDTTDEQDEDLFEYEKETYKKIELERKENLNIDWEKQIIYGQTHHTYETPNLYVKFEISRDSHRGHWDVHINGYYCGESFKSSQKAKKYVENLLTKDATEEMIEDFAEQIEIINDKTGETNTITTGEMKNIFIGEKVVKVTMWHTKDGKIDYNREPQMTRNLIERDGEYFHPSWNTKERCDFGWNVTIETIQEPQELKNTEKHVKALQEYGLTIEESIACLQKFSDKISRTYKKTAKDIYEAATWTCMSYDDPTPPKHYYNSFLDDLRGIDNSEQTVEEIAKTTAETEINSMKMKTWEELKRGIEEYKKCETLNEFPTPVSHWNKIADLKDAIEELKGDGVTIEQVDAELETRRATGRCSGILEYTSNALNIYREYLIERKEMFPIKCEFCNENKAKYYEFLSEKNICVDCHKKRIANGVSRYLRIKTDEQLAHIIKDIWNDPTLESCPTLDTVKQKYPSYEYNREQWLRAESMACDMILESEEIQDEETIEDKNDAYYWLQEKLNKYGNTANFPHNEQKILDELIERFGSTYFWKTW